MAKFFFSLLSSLIFIDMLGRRQSLFLGITFQMLTDIYIAVYVQRRQSGVEISQSGSEAAIAAIYIHAFGYAVGMSPQLECRMFTPMTESTKLPLLGLFVLPYVFGGELWPNRIRSFGAAASQAFHWLFHYAMTAAAPSILKNMDNWGAFVFYAGWCACALIYVYLAVPEIATLSLEEMNEVFKGSWFKAYRTTKSKPHEQAVEGRSITSHRYASSCIL